MNWYDTVMDRKKRCQIEEVWIPNPFRDKREKLMEAVVLDVAQIQAEITWDKAIREVVEWIEQQDDIDASWVTRKMWVVKLKEWGQ